MQSRTCFCNMDLLCNRNCRWQVHCTTILIAISIWLLIFLHIYLQKWNLFLYETKGSKTYSNVHNVPVFIKNSSRKWICMYIIDRVDVCLYLNIIIYFLNLENDHFTWKKNKRYFEISLLGKKELIVIHISVFNI